MRRGGFSLVELLVVLAVVAVLLTLAAPDLSALLDAVRLRAATADLFDAIVHTRAQALARGQRIKLMPLNPDGDFSSGWTVFADRDGDGLPGSADEIIARHGPLHGVTLRMAFTSPAWPHYIAYNGAGRSCSDTNSAAARLGTLSLIRGGQVRRIKINMLGRARICDPAREAACEGA